MNYVATIHLTSSIEAKFVESLLGSICADTEDFQVTDVHVEEVHETSSSEMSSSNT